jgi:hypothetical protein
LKVTVVAILKIHQKDPKLVPQTALTLLVDGDNLEELTSMATRSFVLRYANSMMGFQARGLTAVPTPYPIDEDGETDEKLLTGEKPIKCWQAEYTLQAGL